MTGSPTTPRLDRDIARRFWGSQSRKADDPRSTTLDRSGRGVVEHQLRCYQNWMLRNLEEVGCGWGRVADLACGNGDWTLVLAERAGSLLAVDYTPGFVAHVERRLASAGLGAQASVVVADLAEFEIPGEFDLIVCGAVMQYLDDDQVVAVLRRMHAALRPEGRLYFRTTVARAGRHEHRTDEYQATYRPLGFYREAMAANGWTVERQALTADVVPDESSRIWLGRLYRPLGWLITAPYRAGWQIQRATMKTDVWACVARRA